MKIDIQFDASELGEERLAALSRESIRTRKPLTILVKEHLMQFADDLIGATQKDASIATLLMRKGRKHAKS